MAIQGEIWTSDRTFEIAHRDDGVILVSPKGEMDVSNASELREGLAWPDVLSAPKVRVDLSQVSFLDSTNIGVLVSACKRIRVANGTFSMSCGEGKVRQVLEVAGLIDYFGMKGADIAFGCCHVGRIR